MRFFFFILLLKVSKVFILVKKHGLSRTGFLVVARRLSQCNCSQVTAVWLWQTDGDNANPTLKGRSDQDSGNTPSHFRPTSWNQAWIRDQSGSHLHRFVSAGNAGRGCAWWRHRGGPRGSPCPPRLWCCCGAWVEPSASSVHSACRCTPKESTENKKRFQPKYLEAFQVSFYSFWTFFCQSLGNIPLWVEGRPLPVYTRSIRIGVPNHGSQKHQSIGQFDIGTE